MCQRRRFPEAANLYRSRERSDGGAAMIQRWWKRFLYGAGAGHHLERCPFCGQTFDIRDLGQVMLHRDHQLADDGPPAFEPPLKSDNPPLRNVVPFRRRCQG
jgi:hypothetical protein